MTIDLVLKYLKNPNREYDAAEVAWDLKIPERDAQKALRSLWKGGILTRRKDRTAGDWLTERSRRSWRGYEQQDF